MILLFRPLALGSEFKATLRIMVGVIASLPDELRKEIMTRRARALAKMPDRQRRVHVQLMLEGVKALSEDLRSKVLRTNIEVLSEMPDEEPEILEALRIHLEQEGIEVYTGVQVLAVKGRGRREIISAKIGRKTRRLMAEQILMATGRKPDTENLGLGRAGVAVGKDGAILVNDEMQTSAPHIWAAGDVLGKPMLETVAAKEGAIATENALTGAGKKMDFTAVPHAVFTSPQVASVGLTEEKTMQKYGARSCRVLPMELVPKAVAVKDTRGLIKMVVDPTTGAIVGVHLLAPMAADIIHEAVLAVKYTLTIDDIIDTVHVFPTVAESIKLVATAFRKDVSKLSCCAE